MFNLTFLRIMAIISCWNSTHFPWWLWLYAILLEIDVLGYGFMDAQILKFNYKHMLKAISNEEAQNNNNQNTP